MADPLVTLAEAKAHLRVMQDAEDELIELFIQAASDAVRDVATDWDGIGEAPARIKLAVLTRVTQMFEVRHSVAAGEGELPLLTPLRTLEL